MPRKRKKKPHGQGDPKLLALISDLEARAKLLSIEEQTARVARERHAILVDFVLHQELVLHVLQHGVPLPPGPASDSVPPVASYVARQLLAVTPAQLAEVQAWSSEADIKKLTQDLFQRLVVLLELLQRPASEEEEEAEQEQQQQERPAADNDEAGDDDGGGGGSGLRGEYKAELNARIDRAVTLTCVGLLVNCTPIVDSAANHQAVPEANEAVAAPDHWAKVVRRLGLTQQQLLHLRLAFEEYRRLSAGAAEAGKELLRKAAATRAVEVAAEASQSAAAAAASAGGSASTSSGSGSIPSRAPSSSEPSSSSSQGAGKPGSSSDSFVAAAAAATPAGAATATGPEAPAAPGSPQAAAGPEELAGEFQKHLDYRLLHMTVVSMFLLNTLSRTQIAQMIVASFPFQCVSAAIVEAAAQLQEEQEQQGGAAASAAAAAAPVPDAEAHFLRRRAAMQEQLQRWWQDMGALPI